MSIKKQRRLSNNFTLLDSLLPIKQKNENECRNFSTRYWLCFVVAN